MRNAEPALVVTEKGSTPNSVWRTLESRMMRKYPVRFGEGCDTEVAYVAVMTEFFRT